ncbi:MAG: PilZ domain-containing protein [Candidatus Omnitrophota bacterium]
MSGTGLLILADLTVLEFWPHVREFLRTALMYAAACYSVWMLLRIHSDIRVLLRVRSRIEEGFFNEINGHPAALNERRSEPRLRQEMFARIRYESVENKAKIVEISSGGIRVESEIGFKKGDMIDVRIYLSLFPEPIYVKAMAVYSQRSGPGENEGKFLTGLKIVEIGDEEKKKIEQTVDIFLDKTGETRERNSL